MRANFLASKYVYGSLLALFIASSLFSILGNILQNTPLLQQLPPSWQLVVQASGDLCWTTVGMMAIRRFVPDRFAHKMEWGCLAISLYFALGESVLPQLVPGTADPRDIPAAVIGAVIYYVYDLSRTAYRRNCVPLASTAEV